MTQPNTSAYHVDAALTNISIALLQNPANFVASRVFPNVPVTKQSDKYFTFPRGFYNRNGAKKRAAGTRVAEAGYELSTDSYFCEERGIAIPITDQIRANADMGAPPDRAAAELVAHQLLIEKEVDFVSSFFTAGLWGTTIVGEAATPGTGETTHWSDFTAGDPIGDIRAGTDSVLQSTGIKPNVLTLGRPVFSKLMDHPDIQDRIKGGATAKEPSIANLNVLAQIFEMEEVVVGQAVQNTAAEGDADVHDFILGKNALLSYRPSAPGIMVPSAGYTFSWAGYLGGMNEYGYVVDTKRRDEEDTDMVRGRSHYDHKLTSAALGYFFSGIVA